MANHSYHLIRAIMDQRRWYLALLATMLAAGQASAIDFGWQPLSEGGIEYMVQVEPDLLDVFRRDGFTSDLPAGLRDVRRIRIVVGEGRLPNKGDIDGPRTPQRAEDAKKDGAPASAQIEASSGHGSDNAPPASTSAGNSANPPETGSKDGAQADASQSAEAPHSFPAILQPEWAKRIRSIKEGTLFSTPAEKTDVRGADSVPATYRGDQTPTPQLGDEPSNQDTSTDPRSGPTVRAANLPTERGSGDGEKAEARAWLPLMGALLALFASLGANVYLVWIHQAARAKYRALTGQLSRQSLPVDA
jgi:hypothetical protein